MSLHNIKDDFVAAMREVAGRAGMPPSDAVRHRSAPGCPADRDARRVVHRRLPGGAARVVGVLLAALQALGCGVTGPASPAPPTVSHSAPTPVMDPFDAVSSVDAGASSERARAGRRAGLLWDDLVGALAQLPEAPPGRSIVTAMPPANDFERVLHARLQAAGYALRLVRTPDRAALRYAVHTEPAPEAGGDESGVYVFELAVGRIALRRRYRVGRCEVAPLSSLFVRGADARAVITNDARFASPAVGRHCGHARRGRSRRR